MIWVGGDVESDGVLTVVLSGLPDPGNCRNSSQHFTMARRMALRGSQGYSVPGAGRQRIPALARALEFQALLDAGTLNSRADIARQYAVSRARVTQVMNTLRPLPPGDPNPA